MIVVHECQSSAHKIGLNFPMTIGRYSINSIDKARAMEEEMRRVRIKFFKARKHFDYRGMKNKIKKSCTHVHWVEDVWIDCKIEGGIRRLDYCHLTVEKNKNLDLVNIPEDLEDDGNILGPMYEKNKVVDSPFPFIQWSQKENTSIKARFQNILANTNVWLTQQGIQLKPF